MNPTLFDPAQFLDVETTDNATKRPPLPVGDYTATVGEITCVPWQGRSDPSKSGLKYIVPLAIEVPPSIQQDLGLTVPTIKLTDGIMLDVTEGGTLDYSPGRNGSLRRYREALDMNKKGEVFSARKMTGRLLLVKLTHEIYNGEIQERVGGVARLP